MRAARLRDAAGGGAAAPGSDGPGNDMAASQQLAIDKGEAKRG